MQIAPALQLLDDQLVYMVTVTTPDSLKIKLYYDTKTGLKVRESVEDSGTSATEFSDYHDVKGVKIPFTVKSSIFGQPVDFVVKSADIN